MKNLNKNNRRLTNYITATPLESVRALTSSLCTKTKVLKILSSKSIILGRIPSCALTLFFVCVNISESWADVVGCYNESNTQYCYDENGNVLYNVYCAVNSSGNCSKYNQRMEFTYDDKNNLKSWRACHYLYNSINTSNGNCYSYSSGVDYVYNDGKKVSERICSSFSGHNCVGYSSVTDYIYTDGNQTSSRSCSGSANINSDGSCKSYSSGSDYFYDQKGNMTSQRSCSSLNSDGSCGGYMPYGNYDYTYDDEGNTTSMRNCTSVNSDGSCAGYGSIGNYDYINDSSGRGRCTKTCTSVNSDGSCASYSSSMTFSEYDKFGHTINTYSGDGTNFSGGCAEGIPPQCQKPATVVVDENCNLTSKTVCDKSGENCETQTFEPKNNNNSSSDTQSGDDSSAGVNSKNRWTPSEAAQVVGETNTIILYYK